MYTFTSMIQHNSQAINAINAKYAVWLKNKKYTYRIKDDDINAFPKWPVHGIDPLTHGTPHLLFYKRK